MAFGVKVFILPKVRSISFVVVELSLLYHFYVSATFRKVLALKSMYVSTYEIGLRSGFLSRNSIQFPVSIDAAKIGIFGHCSNFNAEALSQLRKRMR